VENKPYFYELVTKKHVPIFSNYYVYETDTNFFGLMLIAKAQTNLYFVKFMDLSKDSSQFKSYFKNNLQDSTNHDFDWISTKFLLAFMDQILNKDLELIEIQNIAEIANQTQDNLITIYKIKNDDFHDVGFIKEVSKEDSLEMISKLNYQNREKKQINDLQLINDLEDSQAYLLDSIFDNG